MQAWLGGTSCKQSGLPVASKEQQSLMNTYLNNEHYLEDWAWDVNCPWNNKLLVKHPMFNIPAAVSKRKTSVLL